MMKLYPIKTLFALWIAIPMAGCAFSDGNPATTAEFTLEASISVGSDSLQNGSYIAKNNDVIALKSLSMHLSNVTLAATTATGGASVDFDIDNPPAPYENCHAGHCHIHGTNDTISVDEIKSKLAGSSVASTDVLSLDVDMMMTIDAFNAQTVLKDFAHGDLDYGTLGMVRLTFDAFSIEAVNVTKNATISLTNEHLHGTEVHREPLKLQHPLELTIGRGADAHSHIHMILEIQPALFDEIAEAEGDVDFADLMTKHSAFELEDCHDHDHADKGVDHDHADKGVDHDHADKGVDHDHAEEGE